MQRDITRLLRTTALAVAMALVAAGSARAADTVVTFGFDDGLTSQYTHRGILTEHGIDATFFINSGMVGNPNRMSWGDIAELAAEGNEIGGHTVDHAHLTSLDQAGQQHEICDDKTTLDAHGLTDGYTIRNLAYPFGLWNATTKLVAAGCGYDTGRTTGGTDWPEGPLYAETFPPLNAYTLRAIEPRLDTDFATWQDIIQKARDSGGGWVDVVMHDLCDLPCTGFDEYAVSTEMLEQVLDWLDTLPDVKIRTTAKALAVGTDMTAPTISLTAPADAATVTGTVTLSASAADAVGVDHVDFLVDGAVVGSDSTAPYRFHWDSSGAGDSATIAAKAYDEAGNSTTTATRTVTVLHPDVTPPTVALTAPVDGSTVTGTVALTANAADDRELDHVDFSVDGDVVGSDSSAPYAFDWDSSAAGDSATIVATAYDASGNSKDSTSRTVTVFHPDVTPPTVALTAPADAATVTGTVTLAANADDDRELDHVDFLVDGILVGSDTNAPYRFHWDSSGAGDSATITAKAYDATGNAALSAPRTVTVFHPDVTPPTVALTAPVDGSTVTGTVALTADASDDRALDRVELWVDGDLVGTDSSAPYSVDWDSSNADATATIVATAFDASGNSTDSTSRTVTVFHPVDPPDDPIFELPPPVVALTAPTDGAVIRDSVELQADVLAAAGMGRVEFLIDGKVAGVDSAAPYRISWNAHDADAGDGRVQVVARAIDVAGKAASSAPVTLSIDHRKPAVRIAGVVRQGRGLVVRVSARDANGVAAVRVLLPGHVVRTDRTAPFAVAWQARRGRPVIVAEAVDRAGNRARSRPLRVDVRSALRG